MTSRRPLLGSTLLVLGLSLACSGGPGSSTAPAPSGRAEPTAETGASHGKEVHGPARWFFRRTLALSLREDQRARVVAIQEKLGQDMSPHRESLRRALLGLADAVELGQLDVASAARQKAVLNGALAGAKASFADAVNGVHDTLDAAQRVELVQKLAEHGQGHAEGEGERRHGLASLAAHLGLSDEQQARIKDAVSQGLDQVFPDRKARREAWQAKIKAMGEAFVTDDFDAADYDLADHAGEAITSAVEIASRTVDVSNRVLSEGQRRLAADWIRVRAADL